jgi:hypothetical protein
MADEEIPQHEIQVLTSDSKPKRDAHGRLLPGHTANRNGAPKLTKEAKIEKRATKELIADYKQKLALALPELSPILIKMAKEKNIAAIKEINDRVMGKAPQDLDIGVELKLPFNIIIERPDIIDGSSNPES